VTSISNGRPRAKLLLLALANGTVAGPTAEAMWRAGHEVVRTNSAREALRMARVIQPDLLILDTDLEDDDGFAVCRQLRSERVTTPVILLTAQDSADERVRGLNIGADDCLSRTTDPEESVARVAAVLRRSHSTEPDLLFRCRDITLDAGAYRVSRNGSWIHLQPTEFRLLLYFLRNLNVDLDRALLIEHLWGIPFSGDCGLLAIAVSSLRKKVDAGKPRLIHTVRGVGYRMSEPTETPVPVTR
jgi:DNA-binding response OmpR family regulator